MKLITSVYVYTGQAWAPLGLVSKEDREALLDVKEMETEDFFDDELLKRIWKEFSEKSVVKPTIPDVIGLIDDLKYFYSLAEQLLLVYIRNRFVYRIGNDSQLVLYRNLLFRNRRRG